MKSKLIIALGVFVLLFIIIMIVAFVLFYLSFSTVEISEVGILRNSISKEISEDKIYYSGRYYTSMLNSFLIYDRKIQYIEMTDQSDSTRESDSSSHTVSTSSGSLVGIECFIMYHFDYERLPELFQSWPVLTSHKRDIIQAVKQQITASSVQFDYSDFFENRENVQKKMSFDVGSIFKDKYYVIMDQFFLKRTKIEDRHIETKLNTLLNQQRVLFINQETLVKTINDQIDQVKADSLAIVAQTEQDGTVESQNAINTRKAQGDSEYATKIETRATELKAEIGGTDSEFSVFLYLDSVSVDIFILFETLSSLRVSESSLI